MSKTPNVSLKRYSRDRNQSNLIIAHIWKVLIFLWGIIFPAQAFSCAFLNMWTLLPSSYYISAFLLSFPSLMRLVRRKNLWPVLCRQVLPVENNMFFKGMQLVAAFSCCLFMWYWIECYEETIVSDKKNTSEKEWIPRQGLSTPESFKHIWYRK